MFADRLRKSLLQAAITGQLTEQLPTDGDARDLLKKIRAEKAKLVAKKKIKVEKPLPPISDEEIPFDIPDNWCWCRLGDIGIFISGYTPQNNELALTGKIPYFKVADMNTPGNELWLSKTKLYLRDETARIYERNTIVYPKNGGAVFTNKKRILQQDSVVDLNTGGYKVIEPLNLMYVFNYFLTIDFRFFYKGTAVPTIDNRKLCENLFPLPPLAEQNRIVEKLDALLSEVDELAKDERELIELEKNFPRRMKNSLLQAAIQGKLTEQLPTDDNAYDLLRKIRAEKAKLIAEKKIHVEKSLPPVSDDEVPFDLPDNWCWCRLPEIVYSVGSKANQILAKEVQKTGKYPAISQGQKFIDGYTDSADKLIFDVPLIMFGDHTRNVRYIDFPFVVSADGTKFLKPVLVEPKYFYWWLVLTANLLHNRGYNRHYRLLSLELFPLPPLAEQKRICERLEELLPLCEI